MPDNTARRALENACPTLSHVVTKQLRLPRRMAVPAQITAGVIVGLCCPCLCFCLFSSAADAPKATSAACAAVGSAVMMASLGLTSLTTVSLLLILRVALGRLGTVVAASAALIGLAFCVNDSFPLSECLLYWWSWRMATLWCFLLGITFGAVLTGRRQGCRHLWIPAGVLMLAWITLKIVWGPVLTELAK